MKIKNVSLRLSAFLLTGILLCIFFRATCHARMRYQYYDRTLFGWFITDEDSITEMKEKVMIMRTMLENNGDIIDAAFGRIPKSMKREESTDYWGMYIHYERHWYKLSGRQYKKDTDLALIKDLDFIMDVYIKKYEIKRIEKKIKRREMLNFFCGFIKISPIFAI